MMDLELNLAVRVTDEDIDDIMSSALDCISYWCSACEVKGGKYLGDYASEQISRGGTLILYEAADDGKWELTKEKFIKGLKIYFRNHSLDVLDVLDGSLIIDCGMVDGEVADTIVQYALFGELVYG